MTKEREEFTRADVVKLLKLGPKKDKKNRAAFMKDSMEKIGLEPEEVEKILDDLDSYQMLDE